MKNLNLAEQTVLRFISAGLYSALSTVSVVTYYTGVQTWEQFQTASSAFALSMVIGFITGVFMAAHKYFLTGMTVKLDSTISQASLVE